MFLRSKTITRISDEDLVSRLREGEQAILGDLWDRYSHLLYGVGMKYLKDVERSKDLVVELFATLPELVHKHDILRFRPWIHTVMRNRCLMVLRSEKRTSPLPDELIAERQDDEREAAILHESTLQQMERAIKDLNDGQRICIELFHLKRHSYQEVSEMTSYSVEQVRSHLQNGRRNLRLILEHHADRNA